MMVIFSLNLNKIKPRTPDTQKVADEVIFRRFQGEGVEFQSDLHWFLYQDLF